MRTPRKASVLLHFNVPQQCVIKSQACPRFTQADAIDVDSKTADTTRWRNFMAKVGGEIYVDIDLNTKKFIREFSSFWRTHVDPCLWMVSRLSSKIPFILPFTDWHRCRMYPSSKFQPLVECSSSTLPNSSLEHAEKKLILHSSWALLTH